ncbi:hypothetical protein MFLAVUS_004022 [Mucor flavus]|uniref:Uncharacterized protein n=1 Tax=Mucor flavus TaxID=439312 RepID=A0ABP9YUQ9_9FUNG
MNFNNNNYNNNNEQEEQINEFCIPGFVCLTPEEDDYQYDDDYYNQQEEEIYTWIDDSECQENLATILLLNPEECITDKNNHIKSMDGVQLFFEEIGIIYDEPEPIDPSRDYEAEAKILIEERNKTRKHHIELSPIPSLDDTPSGNSSASSSFHGTEERPNLMDLRSPLFLGLTDQSTSKSNAYSYSTHVFNSNRISI